MWVGHKSLDIDDGYIEDLSFSRVYLSRYHNCEDSFQSAVQMHVFHALTSFIAELSRTKRSAMGKKMC